MRPEQIKAELCIAGATSTISADELAVSNVIHGKCNSVRFEFKQGDNPYSDKKKDVKHSTRRRAEAVVRTDNKRKIKLDKARKQLKKTYQKPK
jgi:hypothetical protein